MNNSYIHCFENCKVLWITLAYTEILVMNSYEIRIFYLFNLFFSIVVSW